MARDYEKALDALSADVEGLRADLKKSLEALKAGARGKVADAKEHVEESAERDMAHLKDAAATAQKWGLKAGEDVTALVRKHPVMTVLAGVGAGIVISGVLVWRHSR